MPKGLWILGALALLCAGLMIGQTGAVTASKQPARQSQPAVASADGQNQTKPWWADSGWWLVVVGICTAGVIGWQSWETRKAAQGAKRNIEVFVAAQRPQIVVGPHDNPPHDLMSDSPRVQMELTNQGPTSAHGLVFETWVEILPFPFLDFTTNTSYHKSDPVSVYPGQRPVILNIPLRRGLTAAERHELKTLKKFACIRVKATYRDGFSKTRRWVSFGYWVQSDGLGFLEKYNDSGAEG